MVRKMGFKKTDTIYMQASQAIQTFPKLGRFRCNQVIHNIATLLSATYLLPYLVRLHGALVHVQVPHLGGEVVSSQQVASTVAELDIRHRGYYL